MLPPSVRADAGNPGRRMDSGFERSRSPPGTVCPGTLETLMDKGSTRSRERIVPGGNPGTRERLNVIGHPNR